MRRAFSLVELLVVLLVAAIVIGLLLPAVEWTRWRAQEMKSLANLRSHAGVLSTYAGDERDTFPFFTDPSASYSVVRGGGQAIRIQHFDSCWTWNIALADDYLGGDPLPDSFRVPWLGDHRPTFTMYFYGDCFVARPEFWRHETRTAGRGQWRPTTISEVAYPASKGLVLEQGWVPGVRGREFGIRPRFATVDGSARQFANSEIVPPLQTGVGVGNGVHIFGIPVMHTVDGVLGRDVR